MNNSVKICDWLPDLMPRLPGADEALVLRETFAAVREFCEDGLAWVETTRPLTSGANNPLLYLDPLPDNAVTGYVLRVMFGNEANQTDRHQLGSLSIAPGSRSTGTDPSAYYMEDTGTLRLHPVPTVDHKQAYVVSLSMIPINQKVLLPNYFMSHHRDAIIDGTCSRMMLINGKPYSNAGLAVHHGKRFRNFVKRSRTLTRARYSEGAAWRYPDFAKQRGGYFR